MRDDPQKAASSAIYCLTKKRCYDIMVAARLSSLFYSAIDQKFFLCQEVHISPSIYAVSSGNCLIIPYNERKSKAIAIFSLQTDVPLDFLHRVMRIRTINI